MMTASNGREQLLGARLNRFTRSLRRLDSGERRAIHRTRVASRRLRELLPILELDQQFAAKLGHQLRKITRRLGGIRELDVLTLLIDELHESGRYPAAALRVVEQHVAQRRQRAWKKAVGRQVSQDVRRIAKVLKEARLGGGQDHPRRSGWRWAIDARVARRAAHLKDTIDSAGPMYLPEKLHDVRIALKKLRYGVELAVEASGASTSDTLQTLKRAQNHLGRLHDIQVLVEYVRRTQAALAPADLALWRDLDTLVALLETSCRRLHARYVRGRALLLAVCQQLSTKSPASARRVPQRRAG